jgi:hypothetical protein
MTLNVKFSRHDKLKFRIYYQGMDDEQKSTYCVEGGKWQLCDRKGEPVRPLTKGLEIVVHDATGIIGRTTLKE